MNAHYSNEVYHILFVYNLWATILHQFLTFYILLDNEVMETSKRRSFTVNFYYQKGEGHH